MTKPDEKDYPSFADLFLQRPGPHQRAVYDLGGDAYLNFRYLNTVKGKDPRGEIRHQGATPIALTHHDQTVTFRGGRSVTVALTGGEGSVTIVLRCKGRIERKRIEGGDESAIED